MPLRIYCLPFFVYLATASQNSSNVFLTSAERAADSRICCNNSAKNGGCFWLTCFYILHPGNVYMITLKCSCWKFLDAHKLSTFLRRTKLQYYGGLSRLLKLTNTRLFARSSCNEHAFSLLGRIKSAFAGLFASVRFWVGSCCLEIVYKRRQFSKFCDLFTHSYSLLLIIQRIFRTLSLKYAHLFRNICWQTCEPLHVCVRFHGSCRFELIRPSILRTLLSKSIDAISEFVTEMWRKQRVPFSVAHRLGACVFASWQSVK